MNKNKKRQLNLKNKLLAAIAMLLVSSIMMVSTTYAWFTLSTAPEVQGITTTVGANGNLEIALSPDSGDYNLITSGVGDSVLEGGWVAKNQTWGNLLDLSDASYRLNELTLLPARLNITAGANGMPATLGTSPLSIPVYGADGRISALDPDQVALGGYTTVGETAGFVANHKGYGVRAMGTSSAMTPDQLAFNSALSAMNSNATVASTIVSNALNTYGAALADMAVKHATADPDTNNYAEYVDELMAISNELVKASDSVETALFNALLAMTKSKAVPADTEIDGVSAYAYVKNAMDNKLPLDTVWNQIPVDLGLFPQAAALTNAYNTWKTTDAAVTANKNAVAALDPTQNVSWSAISSAMGGLMNTQYLTVSGYPLSEVKDNIFEIYKSGGIVLELNAGSGVIANFGELSGNVLATVYLSEGMQYAGQSLAGAEVKIATTTQPAGGPLLTQARALITAIGAVEGGTSAPIIDVFYGYAIDFVFRTNAANSSLLLQTEGIDRIYDGTDGATMGNGSTFTFSDKSNNLESLVSLMNGIRVVFTNSKGDTTQVYGIAKVNFNKTPLKLNVTSVTRSIEAVAGQTDKYVETFNTGVETEKAWELTTDANGNMILTSEELSDHQYIVWEIVKDAESGETYASATIKTALYTTLDTEITTTPAGDNPTPAVTNGTVEVEIMANGKPIFFEDLETVDELGAQQEELEEDQVKRLLTAAGVTTLTYEDTYTDEDGATVEVEGSLTLDDNAYADIAANYLDPVYQYVMDQDITLDGPLSLYNYTLNNGELVFTSPMDVQALTTLDQNVATGVTAMVYLDGDYVDNGDVNNSEDGISNTGSLNLQFASSANLVPMTNTALQNSIGVKFPTVEGLSFVGDAMADKETAYEFTITGLDAAKSYQVTAKVSGADADVDLGVLTDNAEQTVTIPADKVTGNIEIVIEDVTP